MGVRLMYGNDLILNVKRRDGTTSIYRYDKSEWRSAHRSRNAEAKNHNVTRVHLTVNGQGVLAKRHIT